MSYLNKEQQVILKEAKLKVRALNHPLRQSLLEVIEKHDNKMNVSEIYTRLRIEQSVASQQLGILRRAGFLKTKREGKFIMYSVDDKEIKTFLDKCSKL